jgi:hypothetical protein
MRSRSEASALSTAAMVTPARPRVVCNVGMRHPAGKVFTRI